MICLYKFIMFVLVIIIIIIIITNNNNNNNNNQKKRHTPPQSTALYQTNILEFLAASGYGETSDTFWQSNPAKHIEYLHVQ